MNEEKHSQEISGKQVMIFALFLLIQSGLYRLGSLLLQEYSKDEEKHSQIVKKNPSKETLSELSELKEQLEIEKYKKEIAKVIREKIIETVNDFSPILFGFGCLIIGISELLFPNLLSVALAPPVTPFALIGVGMGFISNQKAIAIVRLALKLLAEYDEGDLK